MNFLRSMSLKHSNRECLYCGKDIVDGRRDRKFCDSICRNRYHNDINQPVNDFYRRTEQVLRNNHKALCDILKEEVSAEVSFKTILLYGVKLNFITGTASNGDRVVYNLGLRKVKNNEWIVYKIT